MEAATSPSGYTNVNCIFAQSDLDFGSDRKRGGVFQLAVSNLANRVVATHSDKYGRFASQTFAGRNMKRLEAITGYRVTEGQAGPKKAYAQQRAMLVTEGRSANPRAIFLEDLSDFIQTSQEKGYSIILGLDANETVEKQNSGIRKLAKKHGLVNVLSTLYPDEQWASHRRGSSTIDFLFASPDVMECITQAGVVGFDEIFDSDHRPIFLTWTPSLSFGNSHPIPPLEKRAPSPQRMQNIPLAFDR